MNTLVAKMTEKYSVPSPSSLISTVLISVIYSCTPCVDRWCTAVSTLHRHTESLYRRRTERIVRTFETSECLTPSTWLTKDFSKNRKFKIFRWLLRYTNIPKLQILLHTCTRKLWVYPPNHCFPLLRSHSQVEGTRPPLPQCHRARKGQWFPLRPGFCLK